MGKTRQQSGGIATGQGRVAAGPRATDTPSRLRRRVLTDAISRCRIEGLEPRTLFAGAPGAYDVLTYHNDLTRSGQDLNETTLTPANVNSTTFGKLFSDPVDGQVYTQPLYVTAIAMPDGKTHNVIYVATQHDSVYAFDADAPGAPLWKDSFINLAAGVTSVPSSDVGTGDISPEIGITGTPVIDRTSNTLYAVTKTKEVTGAVTTYVQRLHALDLTTGAEKFGGPVVIQGAVPGSGAGKDANGLVHFDALRNNERSALALVNGVVYIMWASHGDNGVYRGWLIGYNAQTLAQTFVYSTAPNGTEAGVWMSGSTLAVDASGNMYFSTGNGTYDTNNDYGNSVERMTVINQALQVTGSFTPFNQASLNQGDRDFGSSGVLLLPDQPGLHPHELIAAGKEGRLYLLDRDNLGGLGVGVTVNGQVVDNNAIQEFPGAIGRLFDTPVYFNGSVYLVPTNDTLKSYSLSNGLLSLTGSSNFTAAYPGGAVSVSANGNTNGIVWELEYGTRTTLRAFNPANVDQEYYDSNQAGARDQLDAGVKFAVPTIANGHVYIGTAATLTVFGLAPVGQVAPAAPSDLSAVAVGANEIKLAWTDNSTAETSFSIERSIDAINFAYVGAAAGGTNTFSDTSAADGTTYYYRVRAANFVASTPSNVATATTPGVTNLVGYWPLDEGGGINSADASGSGNPGSLSGEVTWTSGLIGSAALNFHGAGVADAHLAVIDNPLLDFTATQSFTLGAWVKVNALPGKWAGVITKSTDVGNGYGIYIDPNNKWAFATASNTNAIEGTLAVVGTPVTVALGWHYIAAVQDGTAGTRTLYVDGSAVATGAAFDASGTGDLWMGGSKGNINEYFNGAIDDVRLYNRALTTSGVQSLVARIIPSPWSQQDVGTGGFSAGAGTYAAGMFTVSGSGADIGGTADAFHFVYQTLASDGQIVARVALQTNTALNAKAAVMIRQSLNANSIFADAVLTPGQGVQFGRRLAVNGAVTSTAGAALTAPAWLKLVRAGTTLTAYSSLDGKNWVLIGSDTVAFSGTVFIGLAVTSATTISTATAAFDNVTVSTVAAGTGLRGDYFGDAGFATYKLSRQDPTIGFDWSITPPAPTVGPNSFAVRWTGQVQALYTETYTFYATAADGVRLWVNGRLLIDDFNDHAPTQDAGTIALVGGQRYDIRLDYYDHTDAASVKLEWTSNSQLRQLVPTSQLITTTAAVSGTIYNDANHNGAKDAGEVGLAGWSAYLDINNNGAFDFGDISAVTDANGVYSFLSVTPGTYTVREVVPVNWTQSAPASGLYSVITVAGSVITGRDFGDFSIADLIPPSAVLTPATLSTVSAVLTFTVTYSDNVAVNAATLDNNDLIVTGPGGYSQVATLISPPGTNGPSVIGVYSIIAPTVNGAYTVAVQSGQVADTAGNVVAAGPLGILTVNIAGSFSGAVYNDSNGNRLRDAAELGVANATVFIDANSNGALDPGELSTTTAGDGTYSFTGLVPGGYREAVVLPAGYLAVSPTARIASVTAGQNQIGDDFALAQPGSITGSAFNDLNGNGILDVGEAGQPGVTVYIDSNNSGSVDPNETFVVTDVNGNFTIANLSPGTYRVRESTPAGSAITAPAAKFFDIVVTGGLVSGGAVFANTAAASVTGTVYNDVNNSASLDAGDAPLAGWEVYFDTNNSGVFETGEQLAITDAAGNYTLAGLTPGTYRLREVRQPGWQRTDPAGAWPAGFHDVTVTPGQTVGGQVFGNNPNDTSISGVVYNDVNHDNLIGPGDTGLAGWTVYLDTIVNGVFDPGEPNTTTDFSGSYGFVGLAPGAYAVRELPPAGWAATSPASKEVDVSLALLQGALANFGNQPASPATLSGTLFNDVNANGLQDAGELGFSNQTIFIDANSNGLLDAGEATALTDVSGNYAFTGLVPGTYHVRELLPVGWHATTPVNGSLDITLATAQSVTAINFGAAQDATASISGNIFDDSAGNAVFNAADPALFNWTVYLDTNSNGLFDIGERSALTDINGNFTFTGLTPSTYRVREVAPAGWNITVPAAGFVDVPISSVGQVVSNIQFGNFHTVTMSGSIFSDANVNGARDIGEVGLAGWQVYLDSNKNGLFDSGEISTVTDVNGNYQFSNLLAGTTRVRVTVPAGWSLTTPAAGFFDVPLVGGQTPSPAVFGAVQLASLSGNIFNDANANGLADAGETGASGRTVYLDNNKNGALDIGEPTTLTDINGNYTFTSLLPGTLRVRTVAPAGAQTTAPIAGFYDVPLVAAQASTGINFGSVLLATINANVFKDVNGNAIKEAGEVGFASLTAYIDANKNGAFDIGEPTTTTDANGNFTFANLLPGTYRVRIVSPAGWQLTTPAAGFLDVPLTAGLVSSTSLFGAAQLAAISGSIFKDVNANGLLDSGEVGFASQTLFIDTNKNGTFDAGEPTTTTDANGNFSFGSLPAGTYRVRPAAVAGVQLTTPVLGYVDVVVVNGQIPAPVSFGEVQLGSIAGNIFNDTNGNGVKDAAETGISGRTAFIDLNANGAVDAGERTVTTDANGNFTFTNLLPGTYRVAEVIPAGFHAIAPAGGFVSVTLTAGQAAGGVSFGTAQNPASGSVAGQVFNDANNNAANDSGETGLSGWTVYIDANSNGSLDVGETSTVTDGNGNYTIGGLAAGALILRVVPTASWTQTLPAANAGIAVTLAANQAATGLNFGESQNVVVAGPGVSGTVYNDANSNGKQDAGELGLAGWTVYVDANNNGVLDSNEKSAVTDANGNYSRTGLTAGSKVVRIIPTASWTQTAPSGGAGFTVTVPNGPIVTGVNFGETQAVVVNATGVSGTLYNDANSNGKQDAGELGLAGWTVYVDANNNGVLDANEKSAVTDANGNYTRTGLTAGSKVVRVVPTAGWTQTAPAGGAGFTVSVATNKTSTGVNFGEHQGAATIASISGAVFNDLNYDGVFNPAESGLVGRTVYIDANNNGVLDSGEKSAITSTGGKFSITGLAAGTYLLREVTPAGWVQTTPASNAGRSVVVSTSSQAVTSVNFGQRQPPVNPATISGVLFNDTNSNKAKDSGEAGLANWRVYLDANNNGMFDASEVSVLTSATGTWSFSVAAGTYVIRAVLQTGYQQTTPTGALSASVAAGAVVSTGLFGEKKIA